MGWLFSSNWQSFKDVVNHRLQPTDRIGNGRRIQYTNLAHCRKGSVLWTVWERTITDLESQQADVIRYIGCDLIKPHGRDEGFGYKDMCESMGPYYYTCPVKYLEMVPEVACQEWRDRVLAEHKRQYIKLKKGMIVGLQSSSVRAVMVEDDVRGIAKNFVGQTRYGTRYRVRRSQLSGEVFEGWPKEES